MCYLFLMIMSTHIPQAQYCNILYIGIEIGNLFFSQVNRNYVHWIYLFPTQHFYDRNFGSIPKVCKKNGHKDQMELT